MLENADQKNSEYEHFLHSTSLDVNIFLQKGFLMGIWQGLKNTSDCN